MGYKVIWQMHVIFLTVSLCSVPWWQLSLCFCDGVLTHPCLKVLTEELWFLSVPSGTCVVLSAGVQFSDFCYAFAWMILFFRASFLKILEVAIYKKVIPLLYGKIC